jgi:hypothetical protein
VENLPVLANNNPSNSIALSEDIRLLAQAFLRAKKDFRPTGLGGTNSHQKYRYAKIEDIYGAVEGALNNNDIIIWHFARPIEGFEYLFTRLIHAPSGQFVEDMRLMETEKPGNQGRGASNTYMRKYAVLSLCSIAAEDDDGEDEQRFIERKAAQPTCSLDQIKELQGEIKSATNGKELYSNVLKHNKIRDLSELKLSSFEAVRTYIISNKG